MGITNPFISVVIANLNGEKYLRDCLDSLSAQTFRDFEVIVVDNGSTDGSLNLIKRHYPWVRTIPMKKNVGFAKANNIAFRSSVSEYVATLNNDTIADRGWLEALYETAEVDSAIGMVASKILLGRERSVLDSAGMLIYPDGMSRQAGRGVTDNGQFDKIEEIFFPSACAALYRRALLDDIGFFDEDFVSFCEDTDLGLRARLAGWKALLAPKAVVRHLYSQTAGKYSRFKAYFIERNHIWVFIKDLPAIYAISFPLYTAWRYIIQMYGLLSGRGSVARISETNSKGQLINIVIKAYLDALAGLPNMLRKRRLVWRSRRISLEEYKYLLRTHRITAKELILRD